MLSSLKSLFLIFNAQIKAMVAQARKKKSLEISSTDIKKAAIIYRAVNNTLRQQILSMIHTAGKITVTEIYTKLKIEQPVASAQLKILKDSNFVQTQRVGTFIYYSINYERVRQLAALSNKLTPLTSQQRRKMDEEFLLNGKKLTGKARRLMAVQNSSQVSFTEKELRIISLICDQYQNDEIAKKLKLSKRTVEGYREFILKKMKVKNTAGLVVYAIRHKLYRL